MDSQYRLDALYLLTVADIRATSPHVWNQWKAILLRDLYNLTSANLLNKSISPEKLIKKRKAATTKILSSYGIEPKLMKKIWTNLGKDYLYKFDEHDITWHTRVLVNYDDGNSVVKSRHARDGNGLETVSYTHLTLPTKRIV